MKRTSTVSRIAGVALGAVLALSPCVLGTGTAIADETMETEPVAQAQEGGFEQANAISQQGQAPVSENDHVEVQADEETFTVSVKASPLDGGSATADPQSGVKNGTSVNLSATANLGYKFLKWTSDTADVEFKDASSATTTFTMVGENTTVTANFEKVGTVTVTLDGNGGKTSDSKTTTTKEMTKGEKAEVVPDKFTRDGYKLVGWSLKKEAKSASEIIKGNTIELSAEDTKQDVTYYAQWEKKATHTIKLTDDGNGTATATPSEAAEGDVVKLTATPNDGYEFDAWQVKSGNVEMMGDTFVMGTEDVEIEASFRLISSASKAETSATTTTTSFTTKPNAPEVSNSRQGWNTSRGTEITYTITQEVTAGITHLDIWTDIDPVLEFTTDASGVTVQVDGVTSSAFSVSIDGRHLSALANDPASLAGKKVAVSYRAKDVDGADLSPYAISSTAAGIPYKGNSTFEGSYNGTLSAEEVVKYSLSGSSSGTTATRTSSGTTGTGTSATGTSTLAKTADPTSAGMLVAALVSGAGLVLAGRTKRR